MDIAAIQDTPGILVFLGTLVIQAIVARVASLDILVYLVIQDIVVILVRLGTLVIPDIVDIVVPLEKVDIQVYLVILVIPE